MNATLADEIRAVLKARSWSIKMMDPGIKMQADGSITVGGGSEWLHPGGIKKELEALGRDLSKYSNPQATIHMVLKRMAESGEVLEKTSDGKKVYSYPSMAEIITAAIAMPQIKVNLTPPTTPTISGDAIRALRDCKSQNDRRIENAPTRYGHESSSPCRPSSPTAGAKTETRALT
jgi:hypothetical protein